MIARHAVFLVTLLTVTLASSGCETCRGPERVVRSPDAPPPEPPVLKVARAVGPIEIDGVFDEESWEHAEQTAPFVHTITGGNAPFAASAKVLWDDERLYVAFEVEDGRIHSTFEKHDDHLWEEDCVEVFVDPDGDSRHYFEMQVSPRGVTFDTFYETRRRPQPIGHVDWESGLVAAVSKTEEGYTAEMAVLWTAFAHGDVTTPPPVADAEWRVNFYVMDRQGSRQRAAGWSPPMVGDFHVPRRFGYLRFQAPRTQPRSEPLRLSPDRAKKLEGRLPQGPGDIRDKVTREKVLNRRHPGEPAPVPLPEQQN